MYGCDLAWWKKERPVFHGLKVSQDAIGGDVKHVPSVDEKGLSFDPMVIHQGCNSAFQALNLLVLMGVSRVLLLGCDMKLGARGAVHWHGDHPPGLNNPTEQNFSNWRAAFDGAVPDLKRLGVDVINCTPGSALTCFPSAELGDVL